MLQDLLQDFFRNLSYKFRNENHLSDLTWALCESDAEFKKMFLSFFFKEFENISTELASTIFLHREKSEVDSRPDFQFEYEGGRFIIEIKINDRNDHFIQYKKTFLDARFGWIANYKMDSHEGIEIRSWQEFYDFIFNNKSKNNELINGYLSYLKSICSIVKINKMKLDKSPFFFVALLKNIIQRERQGFKTQLYWSNKSGHNFMTYDDDLAEMRIGVYFSVLKGKNEIYPWIGIYYTEDISEIWFEFKKDWCKAVFDGINSTTVMPGKYFDEPEEYGDFGWAKGFRLKNEIFKKFNEAETVKEQEAIIDSFFNEVVEVVSAYM